LMELWKNEAEVIVIDAARSGSPPGTIHRFEAHRDVFPPDVLLFSTHLMGLPEAIELSRALGELPKTLIVYGIEGKSFEINQPISPKASLGVGRFINATAESLRR
jgi:hydrogenase maturation protease